MPSESHGQVVFSRLGCASCHLGNDGAVPTDAPSLSGLAKRRSLKEILRAVLDPDAEVAPGFGQATVVDGDGKVLVGRLVSRTPTTATLETDTAGRVVVDGVGPTDMSVKSPMPALSLDDMSADDFAALLLYVTSL